jgi:hypothetical protein
VLISLQRGVKLHNSPQFRTPERDFLPIKLDKVSKYEGQVLVLHIRYTTENILLAMRDNKNWQEVLRTIAKRQDFPKVILRRNGIHIEVPEGKGLKFSMNHIFWKKVYTPGVLLTGG